MNKKLISIVLSALLLPAIPINSMASLSPSATPYLYEDFEDLSLNGLYTPGCEGTTVEIANGGYGNSKGSLLVTQKNDMKSAAFPIDMELNETYTLSMKMKVPNYIKADMFRFFMYFKCTAEGFEGNQAYAAATITDLSFSSGEWMSLQANFTFEGTANVVGQGAKPVTGEGAYFGYRIGSGNLADIAGGRSFSYYIDDICVKPSSIHESEVPDVEPTQEPTPTPEPTPHPEPIEYITDGTFGSDWSSNWAPTNATASLSADVPSDLDLESALQIVETGRNGRVVTNVDVPKDKQYELSFYAKGISAKDGVNIDGLSIVPTFEDSSTQKYRVNDSSLTLSTEWKKYKVVLTSETDYTKFYFVTGSYNDRTQYLITDVSIKDYYPSDDDPEQTPPPTELPEDVFVTPEIRNLKAEGDLAVGKTQTITCEYLGVNKKTGMVQIFRQAKDGGWASIVRTEFTDDIEYTIDEADAGSVLKVLIVPMDVTGQIGGYRELEIGRVHPKLEIIPTFTTQTLGETATVEFTVKNYGETKELVAILVLLNEDNTMVASKYLPSKTSYADEKNYTFSVSNPGDAVRAKLFIWEGTSDINTNLISLYKAIEIKKGE